MEQQVSHARSSYRSPERLAYWYLRLNGFATFENFLVHSEIEADIRTDVDVLGVRFAHREENFLRPMLDDPRICDCSTLTNVVIAEVKKGSCNLNGPWTEPGRQNMERVLLSIGCVAQPDVPVAAHHLYHRGRWANQDVTIRLFAFGEYRSDLIISDDQQMVWSEVIDFLISRFRSYRLTKSSNGQWSEDGIELRRLAIRGQVDGIRRKFGLE